MYKQRSAVLFSLQRSALLFSLQRGFEVQESPPWELLRRGVRLAKARKSKYK